MNTIQVDRRTIILYIVEREAVVAYLVRDGQIVARRVIAQLTPPAPPAINVLYGVQVLEALLKAVLMTMLVLALLAGQHDLVRLIASVLGLGG